MRVLNRANVGSVKLSEVEREVSNHHSLETVLSRGSGPASGTSLPHVIAEVITQDEYTHDVVVPWRDGLVLVYGAT
jgi:hypothetical protein